MSSKVWLLSVTLAAIAGLALKMLWPDAPMLGVWGAAMIVMLVAVRIADTLVGPKGG